MKCNEAKKLIPLSTTGDLEPAEASALDEHLASCETCRALLEACRADHALIASVREKGPRPPEPGEFWNGLKKKLEPELRKRRAHLLIHRVVRGITAAAVLLIAVTFLVNLNPEKPASLSPQVEKSVESVREECYTEKDQKNQQGLEFEECELCVEPNREFDF